MTYHRGFAPFLVLIVIALIGTSAFTYFKATQAPPGALTEVPADWRTYTNEQYQFSISFPTSFTERPVSSRYEKATFCTQDDNCFSVRPVPPGSFYDLTQYTPPVPATDYKTITINGLEGVAGTACDGMCDAMNYSFKLNRQPITVSFWQSGNGALYNAETGKVSPLAERIMSTFASAEK